MIGVFDSGYGGLTILKQLRETLPEYDFIYLGDNARAPYGSRSFDVVYEFTRQSVMKLFSMGCHLVILACNTASAKALRSIQQQDLKQKSPFNDSGLTLEEEGYRVLGVIRPTTEIIGNLTHTRHVGIVATEGTIHSESYNMEITKLFPDIKVSGQACPLWAAIVEAGEADSEGADFFVRKRISQLLARDADIDTIILGCTHYPLLINALKKAVPANITLVSQGELVAASLKNYLQRHPEMDARCSKGGMMHYYTTESEERFKEIAAKFLNDDIDVQRISII
jgi:glutamate racemase